MGKDPLFDPYHKWLGIPPDERPLDFYRLLGVPRFESDSEVIASAAGRQMAHVKSFGKGPQADIARKVFNELAKARTCLLDASAKAAYDRKLRDRLSEKHGSTADPKLARNPTNKTSPDPSPTKPLTIDVTDGYTDSNRVSDRLSRSHQRDSNIKTIVSVISTLSMICITCILLYVLLARSQPKYDFLNLFPETQPATVRNTDVPSTNQSTSTGGKIPPLSDSPPQTHTDSTASTPSTAETPSAASAALQSPEDAVASGPVPTDKLPQTDNNNAAFSVEPITGEEYDASSELILPTENHLVGLPFAVNLTLPAMGPVEFGDFAGPVLQDIGLELIPPYVLAKRGQQFFAHPVSPDTYNRQWLVFFASHDEREALLASDGQSQDLKPLANVSCEQDGKLLFQWTEEATEKHWEKLCNYSIAWNEHEHKHWTQLRLIESGQPINIKPKAKSHQQRLSIPASVSAKHMYLEVILTGFPPLEVVTGSPGQLAEHEELKWRVKDLNYLGLSVSWHSRGKQLVIEATPSYELIADETQAFPLSSNAAAKRKTFCKANLKKLEKELQKHREARKPLSKQIIKATRLPMTQNGVRSKVLVAQRKQAIDVALSAETANNAAINKLEEILPALREDNERIPHIEQFITVCRQGATVGFRIYCPLDGHRLILHEALAKPAE
ncbi:MAG: hypothetical protein MK179_19165 [Pirellulaceae bacterium]|nr:hypothetical protein [Pirellulaceae bacterium]